MPRTLQVILASELDLKYPPVPGQSLDCRTLLDTDFDDMALEPVEPLYCAYMDQE